MESVMDTSSTWTPEKQWGLSTEQNLEPGSLILQEAPPYALVSPRAFCGKAGFISIVEIHSKSRNVFEVSVAWLFFYYFFLLPPSFIMMVVVVVVIV
jgi:hypothetical protein